MNKRLFFVFLISASFFASFGLSSWAVDSEIYRAENSSFHLVGDSLSVKSVSNGETLQLGHDTYLRALYDDQNLGSWDVKVMIVDEDNIPISGDTYQTSRKYFNKSVAVKFSERLDVLDENGKDRKVPAGVRLVRVNDVFQGGWRYYAMVMVNDLGETIDWNGNPTKNPPVLKTSMGNYDSADLNSHLNEVISSLVSKKEVLEEEGTLLKVEPHCPGCEDQEEKSELILDTATRPIPRPEGLRAPNFWNEDTIPHQLVMDQRNSLKGKKGCESDRRKYEEELLDKTSWGHLSVDQRADKIYEVAKESFAAMKEVSSDRGGSNNYANSVNANYISPIITPELVTCIAFQETSGSLNPMMQNYTYCSNTKGMTSTAHGLGQMTRGTFKKMKNHPDSDQLPYTTKYSQSLRGRSVREAHQYLSTDPHLQLEVSLRLLNFEVKFAKWKNPNASNETLLKKAVTQYDHDNKSKYVKNVYDQCIPCMKKKSAKECYNETWD